MATETRISLLLGLALIVTCGIIVSRLTETNASVGAPESMVAAYYLTPAVSEPVPSRYKVGLAEAGAADRLAPVTALPPGTRQDRPAAAGRQVAPARPAPVAARRRPLETYTVRANDSLIKIARRVYGRDGQRHYKRIFEANRDVLKDESALRVDQVLVIPPLDGVEGAASSGASGLASNAAPISRASASAVERIKRRLGASPRQVSLAE